MVEYFMILSPEEIELKNGLTILNYEAGNIYSCNLGTKKSYYTKESKLASSLFSDYLLKNGLKRYSVKKDEFGKIIKWVSDKNGTWTRDIICIEFKSGVRSKEEELKHLSKQENKETIRYQEKLNELYESLNSLEKDFKKGNLESEAFRAKEAQIKRKIQNEEDYYEKYIDLKEFRINFVEENKDKFEDVSKNLKTVRIEFYVNGITIKYPDKEIKYKMLYRSAGKAKSGSCMFIREGLYKNARDFLRMGKDFPNEDSKIVEIGAYQSLIASSITGKVRINPANILVISDIVDPVPFERSVIRVFQDDNLKLTTDNKLTDKLKNNLFDGQSLIDTTVFNKSEFYDKERDMLNGYILLRQHFFKSAAFCSDIKQFFRDYCEENHKDYDNFKVKDIWDNEHYVKDIELITTPSSMKWMKFGKENTDYEYWCSKVSENNNIFGICKTAHESKLGNYQRMSYQFVNSIEYTPEISACSEEYVEKLNSSLDEYIVDKSKNLEENEFIKFLKQKSTFSNDYEVMVELCKRNRNFMRTEYFRSRRKSIISDYKEEIKSGKLIQNAENLVIVGSPYAMLLHAAGDDISKDNMFIERKDPYEPIQCYTERFDDGEKLAEFRSPFNGRNNMGYLINNYPPENVKKYFKDFGKQIIAVNMVGNDFQCRNSGSDQDSDFIYCTNQMQIVECAAKYYKDYETIINAVSESNKNEDYSDILRNYKKKDYLSVKYALKDYILSNAQMAIGESSNLAQLCLTYSYTYSGERLTYEKYVVLLSVIAQIAIDNAKRMYNINPTTEINNIRKEITIEYPVFWEKIDSSKEPINKELKCPMNSVYKLELQDGRESPSNQSTIDVKEIFVKHHDSTIDRKKIIKIQEIISRYESKLGLFNSSEKKKNDDEKADGLLLLRSDFEEMLEEIKDYHIDSLKLSSILLDRAFCISRNYPEDTIRGINKNKALLLNMLYNLDYKNDEKKVLECFREE